MPELSESIEAIEKAPKEDRFTYLTILQYHASTPGILPTLNEVLEKDADLTKEIGWDLVEMLIPIEGSEECLKTVAKMGNPLEVIIKVMEAMRALARQWEEDSDSTSESGDIPSRIIILIDMIATLQRRIITEEKVKYPSRFLAESLISVLEAYLPMPEMTTAVINLVRSLSGRVRPSLPPRASSIDVLNPDEHGDFSKNALGPESKDPKQKSLNRKLLQSFTTCILQRYVNVHEMQWSVRLLEAYYPEKIVPGKVTTTQSFREDETLQKRDAVVGQLVAVLRDLGLHDCSTDFVRDVLCQPVATEPLPKLDTFDLDDIHLSQGGTACLIAYWFFSTDVFGADNPKPEMNIFPEHFDMMRLFLGVPESNHESDPGAEIRRNPGIADALLAIGLGLHHRGLVAATEDTNRLFYHHCVTLLAVFHPSMHVQNAAMRFAGTLLHSNPDDESRLDILEDLLGAFVDPTLTAYTIKWLQEEIITAHNHKVSNLFSTSEVIERLREYLFPDFTKMNGEDFVKNWGSNDFKEIWVRHQMFLHQAANFAYFLFNGHKDLVPVGLGALVEQQFTEPLTTAGKKLREDGNMDEYGQLQLDVFIDRLESLDIH
ncbi:YAP-binding/ALF4/Glomulin [Nemania sp. FL0031]|nr:YAP-binding/ALF4/Glomulin [Nemania sp. FL0031]